MSPEHKLRLQAAVLGTVLFLLSFYYIGHYALVAWTVLISAACYSEFLAFSGASRNQRLVSAAAGTWLSVWISLRLPGDLTAVYVAVLAVMLRALWRCHRAQPDELPGEVRFAQGRIFGLVYLVVFPAFVPRIHSLAHGDAWLFFLLFSIFLGDTAAYYVGKNFGRRKLSLNISPGKTREGALASWIMSGLVAVVFHHFWLDHLPLWRLLVIALSTSLVAQAGDLLESLLKRGYQVKDSSGLIPGHGGVFDRFDSLMFAAPFFYLMIRIAT
jgi:phosphatidate cytidylyltransferase